MLEQPREQARHFLARWLFSPLQGVTFEQWSNLMAETRFSIDPVYWPRAALTTISSVGNSVAARREEREYGERLGEVLVRAPIFILGHYRQGTTHLQNLFAVDRRIGYSNNLQVIYPRTFLTAEDRQQRWAGKLTMRQRPHDSVALGPSTAAEDELAICSDSFLSTHMAWHFPVRAEHYERYLTMRHVPEEERERWKASIERFAKKLVLKQGDKRLVFKSPCHTAKVRLLLEAFPDAHFVHIHRDPYRVFLSTRNMERAVAPLFAYQRVDFSNLDAFILRRYRSMYDAFFEDVPSIPDGRFHEVAYSDLDADPLGTLTKLYEALELPSLDEVRPDLDAYLSKLRTYKKNRYEALSEDLRSRIRDEWRRSFEAWGYPQ